MMTAFNFPLPAGFTFESHFGFCVRFRECSNAAQMNAFFRHCRIGRITLKETA